ncbi:hypothetical protein MNB_SV-10-1062 [hydrothermal vent metagenome]|uniref:Uncharacterized protein n=1 Tax=hydrothermal vent metagenome TaxID=652676 RepID=A0A1W1CSJ3_9ZZZZ
MLQIVQGQYTGTLLKKIIFSQCSFQQYRQCCRVPVIGMYDIRSEIECPAQLQCGFGQKNKPFVIVLIRIAFMVQAAAPVKPFMVDKVDLYVTAGQMASVDTGPQFPHCAHIDTKRHGNVLQRVFVYAVISRHNHFDIRAEFCQSFRQGTADIGQTSCFGIRDDFTRHKQCFDLSFHNLFAPSIDAFLN